MIPPPPPPRLLDKGAYWTKGGEVSLRHLDIIGTKCHPCVTTINLQRRER